MRLPAMPASRDISTTLRRDRRKQRICTRARPNPHANLHRYDGESVFHQDSAKRAQHFGARRIQRELSMSKSGGAIARCCRRGAPMRPSLQSPASAAPAEHPCSSPRQSVRARCDPHRRAFSYRRIGVRPRLRCGGNGCGSGRWWRPPRVDVARLPPPGATAAGSCSPVVSAAAAGRDRALWASSAATLRRARPSTRARL